MLARYAKQAGLAHNMPPNRLRHFLFTWLKTQGIDDALIQPYQATPRENRSRSTPGSRSPTLSRATTTRSTASPSDQDGHGLLLWGW